MLNRRWPRGFNNMPVPFGYQSMDPNDLNQQMNDMFHQFNQQLRQLHRLPDGESITHPGSPIHRSRAANAVPDRAQATQAARRPTSLYGSE
jgi:hypothetical protein